MSQTAHLAVPLRKCAPWCDTGDQHADLHPDDRSCWSPFEVVPVASRPPLQYGPGDWQLAFIEAALRRRPNAEEPDILIHTEDDDREIVLTRSEAEQLRDALSRLLDTAR